MTLSLLRGSVRLNTLLPPRPDLLCSRVRVRPVSPGTPQVAGFIQTDRPFFDVHVELDLPHVKMSPPLADIQTAINRCSRAVLGCSKALTVWKSDATAVRGSSIYEVVTRDREVIRVVLLLAGSVEGAKRQVHEFLSTFMKYEYLWVDNMADAYAQFMAKNPTLEDFEAELKMYVNVKDDIVRRQHAALPEEARSPRERLRTLAQISARSPSTESATPTHAFAPHAPPRPSLGWTGPHPRAQSDLGALARDGAAQAAPVGDLRAVEVAVRQEPALAGDRAARRGHHVDAGHAPRPRARDYRPGRRAQRDEVPLRDPRARGDARLGLRCAALPTPCPALPRPNNAVGMARGRGDAVTVHMT